MSKLYAFELDHTSTYLRNRDMHIYYQKLNKINHRKKSFFPKLKLRSLSNKKKIVGQQPLKFATHSIYEKYVIKRDNTIIYNKLDRIHNRSSKAIDDEAQIKKYLNIKKNTREGVRRIKENLLKETNQKIRKHLYQIRPVLNTHKLKNDFLVTREYFNNLKKLKPSQSVGDIFLTKNESNRFEKYFDNHNMRNVNKNNSNLDLTAQRIPRNKRVLKKLGYTLKTRFYNSEFS